MKLNVFFLKYFFTDFSFFFFNSKLKKKKAKTASF